MASGKANATLDQVRAAFDKALPSREDQLIVLSPLIAAITHCEKLGSQAWSVTLLDAGFRLNIGPVEAMSVRFEVVDTETAADMGLAHAVTFATVRILVGGSTPAALIDAADADAAIDEMAYTSVGANHWCYTGTFINGDTVDAIKSRRSVSEHVRRLRHGQEQFIAVATRTPTGKLRQRSNFAQHNCEGLFAYATSVVLG